MYIKSRDSAFKILLILPLTVLIIVTFVLLLFCNVDYGVNDEFVDYTEALIFLANREYKDKSKLDNSNNYMSCISSITYENSSNELTYVSCTNLDDDNYLVVMQIKTPEASNLKESLNYLVKNYKDKPFEYTVEFYEKFIDSNKEIDFFINSFTNSSNSTIINIGKTLNLNLYVLSFTYLEDDQNLKSIYGDYDASLKAFSSDSYLYQEILETDKDIYSIFNL